jgi:hypothetical protein
MTDVILLALAKPWPLQEKNTAEWLVDSIREISSSELTLNTRRKTREMT